MKHNDLTFLQGPRKRSWAQYCAAAFAVMLVSGAALAKPPQNGGGTKLSDLGCGDGEVARVMNAEGEWDCSPALTDVESAVIAAQSTADAAQSAAGNAQATADAAQNAADTAQATADAAQIAADTAQATADARQQRVLEKCGGNSAMWEILENGAVRCREIPANTDELAFLASVCPPGSFLQLDPGGLAEWLCLDAVELKLALGLLEPKLVFVTSGAWLGDLGGVAGADAKCQQEADAEGVPGTFLAWISTSTTSPASRFAKSPYRYELIDGTVIANDWDDLVDGSLQNPITLQVDGYETGWLFAWTGTDLDGTSYQGIDCDDWTKTVNTDGSYINGGTGTIASTGGNWTYSYAAVCGITPQPLYCFEQ